MPNWCPTKMGRPLWCNASRWITFKIFSQNVKPGRLVIFIENCKLFCITNKRCSNSRTLWKGETRCFVSTFLIMEHHFHVVYSAMASSLSVTCSICNTPSLFKHFLWWQRHPKSCFDHHRAPKRLVGATTKKGKERPGAPCGIFLYLPVISHITYDRFFLVRKCNKRGKEQTNTGYKRYLSKTCLWD